MTCALSIVRIIKADVMNYQKYRSPAINWTNDYNKHVIEIVSVRNGSFSLAKTSFKFHFRTNLWIVNQILNQASTAAKQILQNLPLLSSAHIRKLAEKHSCNAKFAHQLLKLPAYRRQLLCSCKSTPSRAGLAEKLKLEALHSTITASQNQLKRRSSPTSKSTFFLLVANFSPHYGF